MFFHLRIFLHSILFFIVLRVILTEKISGFLVELLFNNSYFLGFFIFLFIALISFSTLRIGKKWRNIPIPIILTISSVGLVAFIDSSNQKFIFSILSALIYYFCLLGIYRLSVYEKDQTARSVVAFSAVVAIFFFYACTYGIYLNFTIPLWIIVSLFFIVSCLTAFQYFNLVCIDKRKNLLYSMIIGLAMAEIVWALSFWPFGYLTTGIVLLIFFYILWDMAHNYFIDNLSKKRVFNNISLFGILIIIVLLSSKWLPVV